MEGFEIKEDRLIACYLREEVILVPDGVHTIGAGAFKGCTAIKKVFLPNSIERIEEQAFKGCRQLETISFPEHLSYIGAYAFHRCHHLKEIQLPEKITELSDCAFLYCDGLEQAFLPGVRKFGKQAFVNATSLKKLTISSDLQPDCISDSFTGCTRISEITILDKGTYPTDNLIAVMEAKEEEMPEIIRAIAADIYHMMDIEHGVLVEFHVEPKEVVIPDGIREIGKSCFFNKRGILTIHLPPSLEKIGERAFRNCMNLEHIILNNENVKDIQINKDAFKNCTTLKRLTLNGITYTLTGLPSQTKNHSVPDLVYQIHTQILGNFCISGTVLLRYWGNEARVTIPDGITIIAERAFAGNESIGKLILPESVVEIQREAFADCVVLQTLNFPKGLKQIGTAAFEGCIKLLRAEIPAGIKSISASLFSRCRKLGQIIWEDGICLKKIGQQAFYGCHSLRKILFPETLEEIGALAFYQCNALYEIKLPKSVWKVGSQAFACCKELREAVIEGEILEYGRNLFAYAEKLKKLVFSEKQDKIPDYVAWNCSSLKEVTVSKDLKGIGLAALEGTLFLRELAEPKQLGTIFLDGKHLSQDVVIPEGITGIAGGAFYGNQKMTSITLPDSLEEIGERAFCGCIALREIKLPKKVTTLSDGIFAYCTQLEKIIAEGEIKEVGEKACFQCDALQTVPILYHTKIGDAAFWGCKRWKDGMILDAQIGAYALEGTGVLKVQRELSSMKSHATAVIGSTAFDASQAVGEVTFPSGISVIAPYTCYRNQQIIRVILPEGLKEIGAFAFCGCTKLYEVFVPDSVEKIGESAFEKCTQLLTFSSAAKIVEQRAFAFCETLRYVQLSQIKELQKETFFHCSCLKKLEAKEIEQIGMGCFKNCIKLNEMTFDHIKEIGEEAFAGCEELSFLSFSKEVQIGAKAFLDCCGLTVLQFTKDLAVFDCSAFWGSTFLKEIWISNQRYLILGYNDLFLEELPEFVRRIYASAIGCFCFQENQMIAEYRTDAKAVRIPDGILAIAGEVFKDCIRLKRVEIPESVKEIGERAFWGSEWLKRKKEENPLVICNQILLDGSFASGHVIIPKEVRVISGWAFANAYGLCELTVLNPKLVIEPHAFRNCIYLKHVTAADGSVYHMNGISSKEEETLPNFVRQIFEDALNCYKINEEGVLIECTGNITNFALVRGITAIGNQVFQESNLLTHAAFTEEVEWIGERAFAQCKWLASIECAEGVKEIKAMAFSGCIRLEHVEFSNRLIRIGTRAFENCTSLKEMVLPEGIKEIPERAFFRCRSLQKVVLPNSLERIGEEAFAFCDALCEVVLPEGLLEIGERGFAWCKKLQKIQIPCKTKVAERVFEFY